MISNFEQEFKRDISNAKRKLNGQSTSLGRNKFERNVEIAKFIHTHFVAPENRFRDHRNLIRAALYYEINDLKKVGDTQVKSILQKATATSIARGKWENLAALKQSGQIDANALVLQLGAIYSAFSAIKAKKIDYMSDEQRVALANAALETHSIVADRLGLHKVKEELQEEAFRLGYPKEQREVEHAIREENDVHSRNANELKQLLWSTAEELNPQDKPLEGIGHHEVHFRIKQPYSAWKKINDFKRYPHFKKESTIKSRISAVHDLFAYRVILHNPNPQACHIYRDTLIDTAKKKGWKFVEQKDYITAPKSNGYSSLHLHFEKDGKRFEVQIRTKQMHDHAESGEVNHSLYEAKGKNEVDGSHLLDLFEEIGAKGAETANIKHTFSVNGGRQITHHSLTYRHTLADAIGYALIDRRIGKQTIPEVLKPLKEGKFAVVVKRNGTSVAISNLKMLVERGDHIEFSPEFTQIHSPDAVSKAVNSKELRRHLEFEPAKRRKVK